VHGQRGCRERRLRWMKGRGAGQGILCDKRRQERKGLTIAVSIMGHSPDVNHSKRAKRGKMSYGREPKYRKERREDKRKQRFLRIKPA